MIPVLYESTETTFASNGLGGLPDALSCRVTEQRNGMYELEMVYPVAGLHYADLAIGRIIYAPHDDTKVREPFDVYRITKEINGKVTVNARHVSYRLAKIPVSPFSAGSCTAAMLGLEQHAAVASPFTFWTDKAVTAPFRVVAPQATRSLLAGSEGSILDVYGTGEYEFHNFEVKLHLHRGADTGIVIRYGKNLTDISDETDNADAFTGVYPYWQSEETLVELPEKVVYASVHDNRVVPFDTSDHFDAEPTEEELRTYAQAYIDSHAGRVSNSIKISFVQLWQTEEYKNVAALERVRLCDTVTVEHPVLGIFTKTQIVEVVYDALRERYESMTLNEATATMNDVIDTEIGVATQSLAQKSFVSSAIAAATLLIEGGLGGHVILNTNADGYPDEILIMDTDDRNTATNVIRMNMAGIGFSDNGYNPPGGFKTAWTLDGHFVADWIDTGTLTANLMKVGVLTDQFGRFFLDLDTGEFRFNASGATVGGQDVATTPDVNEKLQTLSDALGSGVAANETAINEILQWITFDTQNGLRIGSDDTGYSVQIKDSEIGFYGGGTRMAYISNQMLFIEDIQVQKSLQFGIDNPEWAFVPRNNGNLSFRYIGA